MKRDGVLERHDVKPDRIKDEIHEIENSEEGLYFVSRHEIGNLRLTARVHKPALNWCQKQITTPDTLFSYRDPRMMGKTDGFTVAAPLWAWAVNPIEGTPIQGVNTCFGLVAPKKDIASYIFLANTEQRFRHCEVYKDLHPWVRPDPKYWSHKHGLRLIRTLLSGTPSLMPLGMESVSTSLHPPILIIDDPIHEQNYMSRAEIDRVVRWMHHSHSLTGPCHGVRGFIGNNWSIGDAQDQLHPERGEDCDKPFRHTQVWERGITGCSVCMDGSDTVEYPGGGSITGRVPGHEHQGDVLPVALASKDAPEDTSDGEEIEEPPEYIEDVRSQKSSFIFLTQHENRLVDPANLAFEKKWLKFWQWHYGTRGEPMLQFPLGIDEGTLAIKNGNPNMRNLGHRDGVVEILPLYAFDFYELVDPAVAEEEGKRRSRFAIATLAVEKAGRRMALIDEYAENTKPHKNIDAILDRYLQWQRYMKKIVIESVAYQATIKDSVMVAAQNRGFRISEDRIENLPRLRSEAQQEDRIKYALIPILEAGNLYVLKGHRKWIGEYDMFGLKGAKRDLLDATSNITRVIGPRSTRRGSSRAAARTARERLNTTDSTGY